MFLVSPSRSPHPLLGRCASSSRTLTGIWRLASLVGRSGIAQMPLTALQKEVLAILAGNRSEESHFAGGVVINAADGSARFSHDFDIFHELAEEVTRASNRDVESLRRAGFQVETPSRYGEWEKESTFRKAKVSRITEILEIDWAADSAFRFFPTER